MNKEMKLGITNNALVVKFIGDVDNLVAHAGDIAKVVDATNGFNGSDITNLLDRIEEISIVRGIRTSQKFIDNEDFEQALMDIHSSVQMEDLLKLKEWRSENDS